MLDDHASQKEQKAKHPFGHRVQRKQTQQTEQPQRTRPSFSTPYCGPYWLLVRDRAGPVPLEVYVTGRNRGEELDDELPERVLPVFSSGEEALASLGASKGVDGWRARETGAGELVSLLSASAVSSGPCAGVEEIVLDPPPEFRTEPELAPVAVSRRCFIEHLLRRGRAWFEGNGT